MADESTVTGFLLAGTGQRGKDGSQNFLIVNKETTDDVLEQTFKAWTGKEEVGIILIGQSYAERIRNMICEHQENEEKILPTILEIPTKEAPYDPTKDTMLVKAASKLYGLEAGLEKLKNMEE
jgi:V-type H+-transporting ATPase subunit F